MNRFIPSFDFDYLQKMSFEELEKYISVQIPARYEEYGKKLEIAQREVDNYTSNIKELDSEWEKIKTFLRKGYDDDNPLTKEQKETLMHLLEE